MGDFNCKHSRRTFLKASATGSAGIALGSMYSKARGGRTKKIMKSAWTDGMQINPNIDNLKVAMLKDSNMVTETPRVWEFPDVNAKIDRDVVHANMDTMARYLAGQNSANDAWGIIFQKPDSKDWKDVEVALKVNGIEPKNMTRIAVVEKVCIELNRLGVPYGNMTIWCGVHNARANDDSKYNHCMNDNGLPAGVKVSNRHDELGGTTLTEVPPPWNGESKCTRHLADGTVDILVNFPVNKGHSTSRGRCTLALKNHFGTFDPDHGHVNDSDEEFDYLISINKSDAILGGEVPRQQLVIMDSIFAMTGGPTSRNPPDHTDIHTLVMGTFAPAMDYATVKIIREEEMEANHSSYVEQFLTSFGYTADERDDFITVDPDENDGKGIKFLEPGTVKTRRGADLRREAVYLHVTAGKFYSAAVKINFPSSEKIISASIYNARGKLIRGLASRSPGSRGLVWDGRDNGGAWARGGTYVVKVRGKKHTGSGKILLRN